MGVAAFQFSNRLRARYLAVHRMLGYLYVTSVFISAPFANIVAVKLSSLTIAVATFVQSFAWVVTTAIALYCVRSGNIVQHRRWMIRSYPFAMVFTFVRVIDRLPPVVRLLGNSAPEIAVWSCIALAAFLPNIFLEWRTIFSRTATKQNMNKIALSQALSPGLPTSDGRIISK